MIKFFISLAALSFAISIHTRGQTVQSQIIGTAGESFKNTSYQLDWSVGELQTETYSAATNILTQGFHQGTYSVSTFVQQPALMFNISAFPNPATDFINLKIDNDAISEIQFTITDFSGKVLQKGKILDKLSLLDFSTYATDAYFLSITQNNQFLKSFKILKN